MRKKLTIVVLLLLILPVCGSAKEAKIEIPSAFQKSLPSPGITPDSWLYVFKRFFESVDLFFTFDDLTKAEKYAKYAEVRLAELKEMAEKGKIEFVNDLVKEYEDNLEKCNEIAKIAQEVGKNITRITELVSIATSIHVEVLEKVLEKVPDRAKPWIQKAINCSKKGNEESLTILEKVHPKKAAEIHLRIAEKRLLKAQQKSLENRTTEVKSLIEEYQERINKSSKIVEIAKGLGENTTNVEQLIEEATSIHIEILTDICESVPDEAKPAIERALSSIDKGEKFGPAKVLDIPNVEFSFPVIM